MQSTEYILYSNKAKTPQEIKYSLKENKDKKENKID